MANIKINNLNPTGSDLFADSESFMTELSDAETMMQGGITPLIVATVGFFASGVLVSVSITTP